MSEQAYEQEDREKRIVQRVANLFAVATLYSGSPTLIDRLANSLSKDTATKVLYDAERIVQSGLNQGDIKREKLQGDKNEYTAMTVKRDEKEGSRPYTITGSIALDDDVEDFLILISKDIYFARKVASRAMALVNQAVLRDEDRIERREGKQ